MKRFLLSFFSILFVLVGSPAYSEISNNELAECYVITHCVRSNLEVTDVEASFNEVIELIDKTPRTKIIEKNNFYIHAEAMTKWMRYVDDLEVKALKDKGILQIRSESRVGIGDNGVNQKRIDKLTSKMNYLSN